MVDIEVFKLFHRITLQRQVLWNKNQMCIERQTAILYFVTIYCILLAALEEGLDRYRNIVACGGNCICGFCVGIAVTAFSAHSAFFRHRTSGSLRLW